MVRLMCSLSERISLRHLVPKTFLRVVAASRRVEYPEFSAPVIDRMGLLTR